MPHTVVITGGSGLIGSVLRERLSGHHDLRAIDRTASPGVIAADARRRGVLRDACEGADAIVHLANRCQAAGGHRHGFRHDLRLGALVLRTAAETGVRRVVIASSNHVLTGWEARQPYARILAGELDGMDPATVPRLDAAATPDPVSPYGRVKVALEGLGRERAAADGLEVLCLRIGSVRSDDRPHATRELCTLLSHRDTAQLVERCVVADDVPGFAVLYGVSRNTWRIWDIDGGATAVGYAPEDDAERFR